ncbi:transposase [Bifidobacterium jacchi]|uniref:transposase n=1 Tax=Bifidobacterium jacchi TaxID=2490545 RepID=UPI00240D3236|nr:transposase [Bifidobacterium jacchi]
MTARTRHTEEFRMKAPRLLEESRANHSSKTRAVASVAQSLGIASETLRRWRNKADRTDDAEDYARSASR